MWLATNPNPYSSGGGVVRWRPRIFRRRPRPAASSSSGGLVSWWRRTYTTSWTRETKKYNNQPVNDLAYTSVDAYLARDENAGGDQNKKYDNQPVSASAYAGRTSVHVARLLGRRRRATMPEGRGLDDNAGTTTPERPIEQQRAAHNGVGFAIAVSSARAARCSRTPNKTNNNQPRDACLSQEDCDKATEAKKYNNQPVDDWTRMRVATKTKNTTTNL